jgi:hypothetical protein
MEKLSPCTSRSVSLLQSLRPDYQGSLLQKSSEFTGSIIRPLPNSDNGCFGSEAAYRVRKQSAKSSLNTVDLTAVELASTLQLSQKTMPRFFGVACSLILTSCALGPSAVDDYEGLGSSQLARTLRSSLFLGESTVNRSVTKLVNPERFSSSEDLRSELIRLGFSYGPFPKTTCLYDGSAKSKLSMPPSRTISARTVVRISIELDSKPLKVVTKITRESHDL